MLNTQINLMYRDADNHKEFMTEVVAGAITQEQVAQIAARLQGRIFVIAEQIGLPTPSFLYCGKYRWPTTRADHVFTTWLDFEDAQEDGLELPAAEGMRTEKEPTLDLDIDTLVARILSVTWDVKTEWTRMREAGRSYNPLSGGASADGPTVQRL
ncbi:hypothetical protein [Burkholderia ubonensis]|uniref:hypothetical protein n=1 Tax=Burkholderia ubonensis TaxID=101571 RepID=UPI000756CD13|nr:hypothetical protein [Burkholderia ubonensis]KVP39855.1 hypothetical protein WJ87_06640 [Burkholderia ubonensis]